MVNMDNSLFIAAAPVFLIASLAMPAGIGGGLLYVPVMLLVGIVDTPNEAAALSQPIVVGAALAANIFNGIWQYRNPVQPLVEPELALSAISPCLAGAIVGSLLNQMLPQAVIIVLLIIVITWNLQNSLRKGAAMWKKETLAKQASASIPTPVVVGAHVDTDPSSQVTGRESDETSTAATADTEDEPDSPYSDGSLNLFNHGEDAPQGLRQRRLPEPTTEEQTASMERGSLPVVPATSCTQQQVQGSSQTTVQHVASTASGKAIWWKLFSVWVMLIIGVVLRGGKGSSSILGVEMCSWQYWVASGIIVASLLMIGLWFRRAEISFILSFLVGVLSAVVGIGGGLILNPMLLATGLDASRTTATVAVMILMTCSSATTTLFLAGAVPLWPMAVLSAASFLGSLSGKALIGWVVSKTGRTSILIFLLAAFMLASGSAVILQGGIRMISEISDGQNPFARFTDPCA